MISASYDFNSSFLKHPDDVITLNFLLVAVHLNYYNFVNMISQYIHVDFLFTCATADHDKSVLCGVCATVYLMYQSYRYYVNNL